MRVHLILGFTLLAIFENLLKLHEPLDVYYMTEKIACSRVLICIADGIQNDKMTCSKPITI